MMNDWNGFGGNFDSPSIAVLLFIVHHPINFALMREISG